MEMVELLASGTSLRDLKESQPEAWDGVLSSIRALVEGQKVGDLIRLRREQQAVVDRWQATRNSMGRRVAESSATMDQLVRARMTVLAIDQFARAFFGTA